MDSAKCIFCKIARGEIPSSKIFEDDEVLAFLDIGPVSSGHTLVIPKKHYEKLHEVPADILSSISVCIGRVSKAVSSAMEADGYNVLCNNGKAAGQLVDHVHFQPRHDYSSVTIENFKNQPFPNYSSEIKNKILRIIKDLYKRAEKDKRIQIAGGNYENWELFYNNPLEINKTCQAADRIYIDSIGNYRGCIYSTPIGNVLEINPIDFLKSKEYQDFLKLNHACNICIHGCS